MGTGKWQNAPLYQKGCCAPEADGRTSAKSKPRSEVPANVSGGVARPWIASELATSRKLATPVNTRASRYQSTTDLNFRIPRKSEAARFRDDLFPKPDDRGTLQHSVDH